MTIMKKNPSLAVVTTLVFMASVPALGQAPPSTQKPTPADTAAPKSEPAKDRATLNIRIEGLRNDKGTIFVSLYNNKKAFDTNKNAVVSGQARPAGQSCVVVFENILPGRYALSFIHDENDNKKLDTNLIGMPKEGFGYSKDAMGRFGPPSFDAAALVVPAGTLPVVMRAKYL
jgi:uncharacterized protein (DUF2141 family)